MASLIVTWRIASFYQLLTGANIGFVCFDSFIVADGTNASIDSAVYPSSASVDIDDAYRRDSFASLGGLDVDSNQL